MKVRTLTLLFLFFLSCVSAPHKFKGTDRSGKNDVVLQKIQALENQIDDHSISEEAKLKLKMEKAKLLLEIEQYDEAVVLLKEVLKAKSLGINDSEVNLYLGKAYYGKSDYGNALNYLSHSERLDKNYSFHERKRMIAHSLFEEEEYYPALAALGKAYNIPNVKKDVFFYETAAQAYYKMAHDNRSVEFFKKAIQVSEMGLRSFPESSILQRIHKESSNAIGAVHR